MFIDGNKISVFWKIYICLHLSWANGVARGSALQQTGKQTNPTFSNIKKMRKKL